MIPLDAYIRDSFHAGPPSLTKARARILWLLSMGHCQVRYDRESDTYYATFNTGEPSYCIEADDALLIEVGLFSNLPTGFRVLNFSKCKAEPVETDDPNLP